MHERLIQAYYKETAVEQLGAIVWERSCEQAEERTATGEKVSALDIFGRTMKSYHKSTTFERFGGLIWWKLLIAYGTVNIDMVRSSICVCVCYVFPRFWFVFRALASSQGQFEL